MLNTFVTLCATEGYNYSNYMPILKTYSVEILDNMIDYLMKGHTLDDDLMYLKSKIPYNNWHKYTKYRTQQLDEIISSISRDTNIVDKVELLYEYEQPVEYLTNLSEPTCSLYELTIFLIYAKYYNKLVPKHLYKELGTRSPNASLMCLVDMIGLSKFTESMRILGILTNSYSSPKIVYWYIETCVKSNIPPTKCILELLNRTRDTNILLTLYKNPSINMYINMGLTDTELCNVLVELSKEPIIIGKGELLWYDTLNELG